MASTGPGAASAAARPQRLRLGEVLVELGLLSEEKMGQALARQLNLRYVDLKSHGLNRAAA